MVLVRYIYLRLLICFVCAIIGIKHFMLTGDIMKRLSLLMYFTIFSFIAFVITGTVLGFFISNHIKKDKLQNVKEITRLTVNAFLKEELTPEDFGGSLSEQKINILDLKFEQIMKSTEIIGIKIWDKSGNILYSENPDLIGKHFELDNDLIQAIYNNSMISVSKPEKDENKSLSIYDKFIEIYEPIAFNGIVSGVFEIYKPYDEIKQHMEIINRIIAIIMFIGLLILYLFLLKIIHNASRTLILQNKSLLGKKIELEESYQKLNSSYKNTIITLSNTVDAKDSYTAGHSERVTKIALEIGIKLNLPEERLELLENAALFHDIGKLGVPDNILLKPGKLTELEFEKVKEHPSVGVNILRNIDFLTDALPIILHHHEKFSGGGYPDGLSHNDIPLESRIIAVADTYDAMTSDRPYRKGLTHNEAVAEIIKFKGIQFDEYVVEAFLKIECSK